jgi:hypothetical protein
MTQKKDAPYRRNSAVTDGLAATSKRLGLGINNGSLYR